MATVWLAALKKSLHCKSDPSEVSVPKSFRGHHTGSLLGRNTTCSSRSGCSRSIANLKDVLHGGVRWRQKHIERPTSCSPRSIGSSELLNPITHEVVLSGSRCELKITGLESGGGGGGGTGYVGSLRPGTPGPGRRSCGMGTRKNGDQFFADRPLLGNCEDHHDSLPLASRTAKVPPSRLTCQRCGEQFRKWEALEAHHLSNHAVTELLEGDSSRKIVEIICKAGWLKSETSCGRIERILKIHNTQKTLSRFEEYRETVKSKASKLLKKHERCLADGNELLRFYGTSICCSLGTDGASNLCSSDKCNVCRILRHGFSAKKELKDGIGVFTSSTSSRALEVISVLENNLSVRRALLVCRVIAGRMHRPVESFQNLVGNPGFDSVAGKVPKMPCISTFIDLENAMLHLQSPFCKDRLEISILQQSSHDLGENIDGQSYKVQAYNHQINLWFSEAIGNCTLVRCSKSVNPPTTETICIGGMCRDTWSKLNFINEAQL